ncbi:nucleotidyltransferase domain-containing protein [Ectobacillus panaciterrae]|uniref:nucleotidyltransferase domain-containing protein n=1 Tax=Ectobacillus panaciterrae TaxID=363872 RepID=UPI00040C1153|nr:nucleotidyltransferase domain-containing protein [Ectobacillus panaciterrae]
MYTEIQNVLQRIEKENDVKIVYAVESGSRAWGFPSKDSDYDVRFLYVHRPEWYLSIDQKRDVLEYPVSNQLDVSGWDIRKSLQLLLKSNPALIEWLRSPIIYKEQYTTAEQLREISTSYISKKASIYHYLHMAQGNFRDYLQGDIVKIKKYFYVLRPLLACMWLEKEDTVPPVEFEKLLHMEGLSSSFLCEVHELLQRKKAGEELDLEPRRTALHDFIEERLAYYPKYVKEVADRGEVSTDKLNELFRAALQEVWQS